MGRWLIHVKVKVTPVQALRLCTGRTAHRGSRGIALLFHDHGTRRGWGVSSAPRPLFTHGKDPVPIVQESACVPGLVWTGAENFAPPPPGFDPRTVQPVASRYTDYATRRWLIELHIMADVRCQATVPHSWLLYPSHRFYTSASYVTFRLTRPTLFLMTNKSVAKLKFFTPSRKEYRGSRGIAPPILNLGIRWKRVVNFTSWPLYLRERTPVPTE